VTSRQGRDEPVGDPAELQHQDPAGPPGPAGRLEPGGLWRVDRSDPAVDRFVAAAPSGPGGPELVEGLVAEHLATGLVQEHAAEIDDPPRRVADRDVAGDRIGDRLE
jgi:hypothetical protein